PRRSAREHGPQQGRSDRVATCRRNRRRQAYAARLPAPFAPGHPRHGAVRPAARVPLALFPHIYHRIHRKAGTALQPRERPSRISAHVIVIAAGTLGHGIAQVTAMAGYDVALVDTSADLARRGIERITANLDEGVRRGKLDEAQREATLARIRPFTSVAEAAPDAFLAVEAVPERLDLK